MINLFGELGVTVSINGEFTSCRTTEYHGGVSQPINHCMEADCEIFEVKTKAIGTVKEHAEMASWQCTMGSGAIIDAATRCGTKQSSGTVDIDAQTGGGFSPERPHSNCSPCGEIC